MTRRIEFRGLVDGEVLTTSPGDGKWEFFWNTVDPDSVSQFVGRMDRDGLPIYEGDEVSCRVSMIDLAISGRVIFESGYFGVRSPISPECLPLYGLTDIVVLGNAQPKRIEREAHA